MRSFLIFFTIMTYTCVHCRIVHIPVERDHIVDYYTYPKYKFQYEVSDPHTGDHKQQWEHRDGDHVQGSYSLVQPDGSTRVVEYTSGPHVGFNAIVKNIGHSLHPGNYYHDN